MCAVEEMVCVLQHSGCDLVSTLSMYDLMSEAGKYLFRAANVWWMCAQYFVIASCG